MEKYFLDTETTGLEEKKGNIVDLAVVDERGIPVLDTLLKPTFPISPEASAVHGLTAEMLANEPSFGDIAEKFINIIRGKEIVIHNAAFDTRFVNEELSRLDLPPMEEVCLVTCSLQMAKDMYPSGKRSLDEICDRFKIDKSARTSHRANVDAILLSQVFPFLKAQHDNVKISDEQIKELDIEEAAEKVAYFNAQISFLNAQKKKYQEQVKATLKGDKFENENVIVTKTEKDTANWEKYCVSINPSVSKAFLKMKGFVSTSEVVTVKGRSASSKKKFLEEQESAETES